MFGRKGEVRKNTAPMVVETGETVPIGNEDYCIRRLVERLGRRNPNLTLITLLIDCSGSMSQEVIDDFFPGGVCEMLEQIRENAISISQQAIVRVMAFSSECSEVIPWMPVEDAIEQACEIHGKSHGATRLDLALNEAICGTRRMKDTLDAAFMSGQINSVRRGSVIMTLTDGFITDSCGKAVSFPSGLAQRIKSLQDERKATFMAIGVGDSVASQLAAMAPKGRIKGKDVPHAIKFEGDAKSLDWDAIRFYMAKGSSGPAAGNFASTYNQEQVVTHAGFELVF